jgi:hypothetical protein
MKARLTLVAFVLIFSFCLRAAPPTSQPATEFIRFVEERTGDARLESADATYKNRNNVVVHLIAAVHIADPEYFRGLDESFNHYDALLYEMVKPKDMDAPTQGAPARGMIGMFQRFLTNTLKLQFQLDAINYKRPNFVHADLDWETFQAMQDERGESMLSLMLNSMLYSMGKSDAPQIGLPDLLGALGSPDRDRQLRLLLARQFKDIDEQITAMQGKDGTVLVTERNKAAMKVLDQTIMKGRKNIGIFYGGAHLRDMEQRLYKLGFTKIGVTYRTAWNMPAPPTTQPATTARARATTTAAN